MNAVLDPAGPLGVTLAYVVLGAGVIVTALTLAPQLRRLPAALGEGPPALTAAALAASTGVASVAGAALAVTLGGPGALPWMWLAAFFGMGFAWLDTAAAARSRGHDARGALIASPMLALEAAIGGAVGKVLALLLAFSVALAALGLGALLQAQQLGALLHEVTGAGPAALALLLVVAVAALSAALARPRLRHHVLRAAAWALGIYCLLTVALLLRDPAAVAALLERALDSALAPTAAVGGAAGGALGLLAHGVLRAATGGATGLGALALSPEVAHARDPERAGARAMLAPLLSVVVGTLSALALLAHGPSPTAPIAERELVDLEPHHSRGLLPSERGQTFVLPEGTPLEDGRRYPMVLRASPRGHKVGHLFRDDNIVALQALAVAAHADTVVLRDRDPRRAHNPGFDIVIPCEREVVDTPLGPFLKLKPRDPAINFRALMTARGLDGPYIVLDDFRFIGAVERAISGYPGIGEHLSLYQDEPGPDAPPDLSLRDALALGFRGPFFDDGEPALPRALPAAPAFAPEIGAIARLRFTAPERGLDLGFLNRVHELEVPAWDFLAAANTAIFRHRSDPALDLRVLVHGRLAAGRLRFTALDPELTLRDLAEAPDYEGPFLLPPPAELEVEVHGDARLPERLRGRRALLPLNAPPTATGLLRPDASALLSAGLEGPFLATDGAGLVALAWLAGLGPAGAWVLALAALALTLVAMATWASHGAAALRHALGDGAAPAFRALFLVFLAVGAGLGLLGALRVADAAVILCAEVHLLGLALIAAARRP